ncbi:thioredoxin H-type 1-like [Telopea speciosissima]|uniref:thioredoxin H-type 1-like n=1 Tax=Telopea speciosissima TaxID=54955 RepID=UPI001CC53921|nr:thioredoxin H-type 1-like [Telopea speciosissima]
MAGQVIICSNLTDWENHMNSGKVMAFFTAPWSGPAHKLSPTVRDLAMEYPSVKVLQLDMRHFESLANAMKVEAAPAFLFMKDGKQITKLDYAKPEQLYDTMEQLHAM